MVVTENDCHKIVSYVAGSDNGNVGIKSFKVSPLSDGVTGFLSNHLKLNIHLNLDKLNDEEKAKSPETIKAFVKALPTSPDHEKYVKEVNAFEKEYHNFSRLFPSLQLISRRFNHAWAPDCYLSKDNMLVFEDLSEIGFRMLENGKLMDLEHLEIAAKTLGYFHSASVIFEAIPSENGKKNNIKEEYANCILENSMVEDPNNVRYHWYNCGMFTIVEMVKKMKKYSPNDVVTIERRLSSMKDEIKAYFKSSNSKTNVVCHGDVWGNNFMFRYNKDNRPVECRLVDFQMTRYAPGCLDLTSMICMCTDKITREENKIKIIAAYEKAFNQQIQEANVLPPQTNFVEDYEYFRPAALVESILFEMITRMDEEATTESFENPNVFFYGDRSKIVLATFERNAEYRDRLKGLVEELIDDFILV